MKEINISVGAGASQPVYMEGSVINVKASGGSLKFKGQGFEVSLSAGQGIRIKQGFDNFTVENESAGTIAATLVIGTGDFSDNSLPDVSFTKSANASDQADESIAAGTAYTLAANSARREALITNLSTNTDPIRVGPNAAANRGTELLPGSTGTFETTATLKIHNTGAGAQSVAIVELED
ncbi:MAG: hypothetical protein OQL08_01505 [Gammaproteobacteria bacterium]|nr:hypothetical protein [Gammaproteobacteria bacterium]